MFGIVLTAAFTLMHLYVFVRAASVPVVRRRLPRWLLSLAGILLWGLFVLGRYVGHGGTGPVAAGLELAGMSWMGVVFLTSILLLAVDIVTAFGFLFRRWARRLRGWALIGGATLSVIALVQGLRPPVVQPYEVRMAGLPPEMDGAVLVALSDLHVGSVLGERWLATRVAQVQALEPDIVVLLGDLFEGHGESREQMLPVMRGLSAPLGVWAVSGNHESFRRSDTTANVLDQVGIVVLQNRWVEVRPGLVMAGVEDLTSVRRSGRADDPLRQALAGRPAGATILLSHTPWKADAAAAAGVGLMLSGHTHGGQIWPFGYLVRLVYPLVEGRYQIDGMTLIVSRGTGTWGPRMRLWRPGEILRVTLRRGAADNHTL